MDEKIIKGIDKIRRAYLDISCLVNPNFVEVFSKKKKARHSGQSPICATERNANLDNLLKRKKKKARSAGFFLY